MSTTIPNFEQCCETPERRFAGRAEMGERTDCDAPKVLVCLNCGGRLVVRCRSSRSSRCSPCSESYRRKVMTVCASGSLGWGDDDRFLQGETFMFLTVTAPGEEQHTMPSGDVCPCTPPGGVDLAVWNATSGKRWSRFVQALRRELGDDLQYFKGVELQKRGAIHFHAICRLAPGRGGRGLTRKIRQLAMHHGFGHSIDAQPVPPEKVAGYIAKYASKATDDRHAMPWCDRHTGEKRIGEGRYRVWSASRHWGLSMGAVNRAQAIYAQARAAEAGAAAAAAEAGEAGPLDHKALCSTSQLAPP